MEIRRFLAMAMLVALLAACAYKSEDTQILPWLKSRVVKSSLGGFGGSTQTQHFTRHYFLYWKRVDGHSLVVLGPDAVVLRNKEGVGLLRRGDFSIQQVCPLHAALTIPAVGGVFDCVTGAAFTDKGRATRLRFRRHDATGATVEDHLLTAAPAGHVWNPPDVAFHDDTTSRPLFVAITEAAANDFRVPDPDCTLFRLDRNGEATPVARLPQVDGLRCVQKKSWSASQPALPAVSEPAAVVQQGGNKPATR